MQQRTSFFRLVGLCVLVFAGMAWPPLKGQDAPTAKLATVNGLPITSREVKVELLLSGRRPPTADDQRAALERVIDRRLISQLIESPRNNPLAEDVENLLQATRAAVESGDDTLEAVLTRLKLTEDDLRAAFRVTVAWQAHVRKTIPESQLRTHFEKHRPRFDGTEVRLQQIVRSVKSGAPEKDWTAAETLLTDVRRQLVAGDLSWDSAACEHSQSPTAASGGDLGFIKPRGQVPTAVSSAAFVMKVGEVSPVIRSSVGVHLIEVTEIRAGELSLEDARPELLRELGDELWRSTVKGLRAKAKIVYAP